MTLPNPYTAVHHFASALLLIALLCPYGATLFKAFPRAHLTLPCCAVALPYLAQQYQCTRNIALQSLCRTKHSSSQHSYTVVLHTTPRQYRTSLSYTNTLQAQLCHYVTVLSRCFTEQNLAIAIQHSALRCHRRTGHYDALPARYSTLRCRCRACHNNTMPVRCITRLSLHTTAFSDTTA